MKVHLKQIPVEGLHLKGEENAAFLELEDPDIRAVSPVRYALEVGLSHGGLFATGTIEVDLEMQCVSCLGRFVYPLRIDSFALQTELGGSELVDLTPQVREDIVLALPPHPHCDWSGDRECAGLQNLSAEPLPEQNVWGELDKLKLRNN